MKLLSALKRRVNDNAISTIKLKAIKKEVPFIDLFPVKKEVMESITNDMRCNGYDVTQPIIVWKERGILIDGHTRCLAAANIGLKNIPVTYESFNGTDDAVRYAYKIQFYRRSISEGEKLKYAIQFLESAGTKKRGNNKGSKKRELASILSVSQSTAQKYLTLITRGSKNLKEKVEAGNISLNRAYNSIVHKEKGKGDKSNHSSNNASYNRIKSTPESIKIDIEYIQHKLDSWAEKRDMTVDNCYVYRSKISGALELLPDGSDIKQYALEILAGGEYI